MKVPARQTRAEGSLSPAPPARRTDNPVRPDSLARLERARAALATVADPELPFLTIDDLGLVRSISLSPDGATLEVAITPTYLGCPATDVIALEVEVALARANVAPFIVRTVLKPAWTTDWLSPQARAKLLENGIAPPAPSQPSDTPQSADPAARSRALLGMNVGAVACPRCGSTSTVLISQNGSTRCKAQIRCESCLEPFEHFKCH